MKRIIPCLVILLLAGCASRTPESTAKRYCEALLTRDFPSFRALFEKDRQQYLSEDMFNRMTPTSCAVQTVAPPYATIRYRIASDGDWPEAVGSLYILPDGSIKYDPIFCGHPAVALRGLLSQMVNDDIRFRQSAFHTLTNWELPLFEYTPDADPKVRTNSVAQFKDWVRMNEARFDLGKVKIPVSPADQERIEKAAHNKTNGE